MASRKASGTPKMFDTSPLEGTTVPCDECNQPCTPLEARMKTAGKTHCSPTNSVRHPSLHSIAPSKAKRQITVVTVPSTDIGLGLHRLFTVYLRLVCTRACSASSILSNFVRPIGKHRDVRTCCWNSAFIGQKLTLLLS